MKIMSRGIGHRRWGPGLAVAFLLCGGLRVTAEEAKPRKSNDKAPLGSMAYYPSPERPVGWRGDGTGRYPGATPPLHWGRVAKSVKSLRSQATKPKEGETGKPIPDGTIREWLILGPISFTNAPKNDVDLLPDEARLEPTEGQKSGGQAWKKVSLDSQTIVFRDLFGIEKQTQAVAYAYAYVHSERAQKLHMNVMCSEGWLLLNGAPIVFSPLSRTVAIGLQEGWNRLLFRVHCVKLNGYGAPSDPLWYLRIVFYSVEGSEYESANIAWSARLPGQAISTPIIVGDKIFATAMAKSLCCLDKNNGRLLWMRTITLYDVATEEEKKANTAVFEEIAPLAAELRDLDLSIKPGGTPPPNLSSKMGLEGAIWKLMQKVDPQKYRAYPSGECADAAPTPTSDGRNVYVTFHPYLNACLDLDGNVKWVSMHAWTPPYNGRESHGLYISSLLLDGKLIGQSDCTLALDAATGKPVWQAPAGDYLKNYSSALALKIKDEPLVLMPPMNIFRAQDGKQLSSSKDADIITPAIAEGRIFRIGGKGLETISLPDSTVEPFNPEVRSVEFNVNRFPRWWQVSVSASPLYHEGLVYCMTEDGVLSVVDTETQEVVYQKLLDLDLAMVHAGNASRGGACASPALAGKYIYFFGHRGTCVVIEPGRSFRQVARNRIDNGAGDTEIFASCPVFEGKRLYYRGTSNLYCIEEDR